MLLATFYAVAKEVDIVTQMRVVQQQHINMQLASDDKHESSVHAWSDHDYFCIDVETTLVPPKIEAGMFLSDTIHDIEFFVKVPRILTL